MRNTEKHRNTSPDPARRETRIGPVHRVGGYVDRSGADARARWEAIPVSHVALVVDGKREASIPVQPGNPILASGATLDGVRTEARRAYGAAFERAESVSSRAEPHRVDIYVTVYVPEAHPDRVKGRLRKRAARFERAVNTAPAPVASLIRAAATPGDAVSVTTRDLARVFRDPDARRARRAGKGDDARHVTIVRVSKR